MKSFEGYIKKISAKTISFIFIMNCLMMSGCGTKTQTGPAPDTATNVSSSEDTVSQEDAAYQEDTSSQEGGIASPENSELSNNTEEQETENMDATGDNESASTDGPVFKMSEGITIPDISQKDLLIPDGSAFDFVYDLGVGFNLGNTFDAYLDPGPANEMDTETCWHHTYTTEQMIKDIHSYGFDTIRIPVSWHNHVDDEINISQKWLDRVNEVVDWAIDDGMYVIINIHHDNHQEAKGFYPDFAHRDQSVRYISRIWEQLSERFKDYDEHLIFESMNEPRLVGHTNEWWIDPENADCIDSIKCINELNQVFVDTVRGTGGNNTNRYLMCPGYDASPDGALNRDFVLPTDPAAPDVSYNDGHILVAVHAYIPYDFALEYPGISDFDASNADSTRDLDTFMNSLYTKLIKNNYPVVIGEFGCRDKNGNLQDRVDFSAYYVRNARARGMACFWWDNNAFKGDGELFGIYDRNNPDASNFDIINALMAYK